MRNEKWEMKNDKWEKKLKDKNKKLKNLTNTKLLIIFKKITIKNW